MKPLLYLLKLFPFSYRNYKAKINHGNDKHVRESIIKLGSEGEYIGRGSSLITCMHFKRENEKIVAVLVNIGLILQQTPDTSTSLSLSFADVCN